MADQIEIQIPKTRFFEETNFDAVAYFRDRATKAASTPTTAEYTVEDLATRQTVVEWTSLTPASNITIPITSTLNVIQDYSNKYEKRLLIVMADRGLSTQAVGRVHWLVDNLRGIGAE